jgi:very-short-patch-repair endonuclease
MLCFYGCGQKAQHQFKNGKWCCVDNFNRCEAYSKKLSKLRKGKISPHKGKKRNYSAEARKKMGDSTRGKSVWNSGLKNCFKKETIERMKNIRKGKSYWSDNQREIVKNNMLNGGAIKAIKGIKRLSKQEIELREMVKKLFPNCEYQFGIFNYSVDVAILRYKLAIEFDGYYHFDTEDHKEYHKQRQEKIEKEGWKFLRYSYIDKIPNLIKLKEDINKIISEEK